MYLFMKRLHIICVTYFKKFMHKSGLFPAVFMDPNQVSMLRAYAYILFLYAQVQDASPRLVHG